MTQEELIYNQSDHLFRHEAGKMVSVLTRIFGTENLQTAEDVVQDTLLHALQIWKLKGIPDNPSAWLFRVAKNKAIDIIRRNKHAVQYDFSDHERILLTSEYSLAATMNELWQDELVKDDLLRMMFACCHPGISEENQVTLILKTLCGFSTAEIARAFFISEETVTKRLYRTKEFFRQHKIKPEIPSVAEMQSRTGAVLNAIYLLFNEGYNATSAEELIRKDVMEEAALLCGMLTENEHTQAAEAYALMALICFHSSRTTGRLTEGGEIILLSHQDRNKWNTQLITKGNEYMNKAAFGECISTYHLEAAISFEHCKAANFESTDWIKILEYYDWLCKISSSPVVEFNRAIILLKLFGAGRAFEALQQIKEKEKLEKYYLYHSLVGELYLLMSNKTMAATHFEKALQLTQSETERKLLRKKIAEAL